MKEKKLVCQGLRLVRMKIFRGVPQGLWERRHKCFCLLDEARVVRIWVPHGMWILVFPTQIEIINNVTPQGNGSNHVRCNTHVFLCIGELAFAGRYWMWHLALKVLGRSWHVKLEILFLDRELNLD